jgi:hypothetical protein
MQGMPPQPFIKPKSKYLQRVRENKIKETYLLKITKDCQSMMTKK